MIASGKENALSFYRLLAKGKVGTSTRRKLMIANRSRILFHVLLCGMLCCLLCVSGCAMFSPKKQQEQSADKTDASDDKGKVPLYYDFGDVLVPREMKLQKDKTFVFRTPGLTAGVLVFKGRVEINSLIAFFETNMIKDNWTPISSFKSPRTFMLYKKENRWCVISITENEFSTSAEIWVTPTIANPNDGLLK